MIGTLPMRARAPLDYSYAMDAAMPTLFGRRVLVQCKTQELLAEVYQRLQPVVERPDVALWIEPHITTWQQELTELALALPNGAPLVLLASRPLARFLPEHLRWLGTAFGARRSGISTLTMALHSLGFTVEARHSIHTLTAIGFSLLGQVAERLGRPDRGDQLRFAARMRYCNAGTALSTVALLFARRECG